MTLSFGLMAYLAECFRHKARFTADEEICFSSAYSRHHISPSMSYFVYFFNNLRAVHFQHTCSSSE